MKKTRLDSTFSIKKGVIILLLFLMSIVTLFSQESYNKYYYKSKISSEDMQMGIMTHQTESEKEWVKEWKQQLREKADSFKDRTGFAGNIKFHDDRASLDEIVGKFACTPVVDSISAISSANQILDEIIDLINIPRNQLLRTSVRKLKYSDRAEWVVVYSQFINGIEVNNSGIGITYKANGTFKRCSSICYPDLSTDIYPQYTENQIEEQIRIEADLPDEYIFKNTKLYYSVGKLGELSLQYSTYYLTYKGTEYDGSYKVIVNALTGEIISHLKYGFN